MKRSDITDEQAIELARRWHEATAQSGARWLDLPYRLRVRFWFRHRIDGAAIWLAEHHHFGAAIAVWRARRMW